MLCVEDETGLCASLRRQLIERIEWKELDAGLLIDRLTGDLADDIVHHACGATVTVMHRHP